MTTLVRKRKFKGETPSVLNATGLQDLEIGFQVPSFGNSNWGEIRKQLERVVLKGDLWAFSRRL